MRWQGYRTATGRVRDIAIGAAGGRRQVRVILTLAAVLALSGADTGTVSATADNLERAFHIGNTQIGVLVSVVALIGALFTLPAGVLVDRTRRTRLLGASVAFWAVATVVAGISPTYLWLLLARMGLGAAIAVAAPALASLTGDYFPAADRARIYGLILAGDLAGSGIGYLVSGDLSSLTSWRVAFLWLVVPSLALAWAVWRLPEPVRGGSGRIAPDRQQAGGERTLSEEALCQAGVEPRPELVLREDPTNRSVWWAVRYVLRVRTNVVIIVTSALGYFYFAGLRAFAVIFATGHYGISKPTATSLIGVLGLGALAGVFAGGRVADRLLRRGHVKARILVPAVCLLALPLALAPAIATTSVAVALPLLLLGAFLLGAPNPPLDAARLDIMHPRLWGRAEAVRTVVRSAGEAAAPLAFGFMSQYVFGGPGSAAGAGGSAPGQSGNAAGLEYTFLLFLIPLLAAGLLSLAALRLYPRDVATASASVRAIEDAEGDETPGERPAA